MSPDERRAFLARLSADGPLSRSSLQAIADASLMDANRIFLPAGTLTEAEFRAREARIMKGETL